MITMKKSKLLTAMLMLWALISCAEISAQEIQQVSKREDRSEKYG